MTFCTYSPELRRIIYTTDAVEGLHHQSRKATKTKAVFPHGDRLRKMLFLAGRNIMRKWTVRYRNWDQVLGRLTLLFPERQNA